MFRTTGGQGYYEGHGGTWARNGAVSTDWPPALPERELTGLLQLHPDHPEQAAMLAGVKDAYALLARGVINDLAASDAMQHRLLLWSDWFQDQHRWAVAHQVDLLVLQVLRATVKREA